MRLGRVGCCAVMYVLAEATGMLPSPGVVVGVVVVVVAVVSWAAWFGVVVCKKVGWWVRLCGWTTHSQLALVRVCSAL